MVRVKLETFGQRLVAARGLRRMTQRDLVVETDIILSTISRLENDLRLPTYQQLRALCIALQVSGDYLLRI